MIFCGMKLKQKGFCTIIPWSWVVLDDRNPNPNLRLVEGESKNIWAFAPIWASLLCLEFCSPKRQGDVLSPSFCECDLIWKQGLCRCNQVKLRSYWIRVGPNPVTDSSKKREIWAQGHRRGAPCDDRGRCSCKPKNAKGLPATTRG